MKLFKYIAIGSIALMMGTTSCVNDLDLTPTDPNLKLDLTEATEWYGYFGSLYGTLIFDNGVSVSDGGAGVWMRCQWNLQEITADEAVISRKWNDPGYDALNFCTWLTNNEWVYASFTREFYTAKQCSEFIAQMDKNADSVRDLFAEAGVENPDEEMASMKAEARVLRAYAYWYMIDLFGRGPWIDENSLTGAIPPTYDRKQLFDATVADLKATIESGDLRPAAKQVYGRLSREAARAILAKLYLNAEVYTGTPMYRECADQCKEIVKTINQLAPTYKYLFCGDNDQYVACKNNGGNGEIIFAIPQQHQTMESWGNTTYLTAGSYNESMPESVLNSLGISAPGNVWSGLRMRPELSQNLIDNGGERNLVFVGQYQMGLEDLSGYDETSCGYICIKYTLTNSTDYTNEAKVYQSNVVCNADFPVIRLADIYLMLTECQIRGIGDADPGYAYFNKVRDRAGLEGKPTVSENDLLKERQSELYYEGHRRSDLIRFGRFTGGNYLWSWKGGVYEGASIPAYRSVFAIPQEYTSTVGQNPGY